MAYLIGILAGALISWFASVVGLSRDRSFYPTVLIVVGSYYLLFAAVGNSVNALIAESIVMALFVAVAVAGFKRNLWLVAAGLIGHGAFDWFHAGLIANPGVPTWWPMFCMSIDIALAPYLIWLLHRCKLSRTRAE